MSFPYQDGRRRQLGAGAGFGSSGRRTVVGYWVPLALTVGIATAGVAAWIWSERSDEEEEDDARGEGEGEEKTRDGTTTTTTTDDNVFSTRGGLGGGTGEEGGESDMEDYPGMVARMHNTLRRTPSPQQILDGASKRVAAGMAAAGTFFGGLASIQEENGGGFEDHSRWSEEVQSRNSEREQEMGVTAPTMSGAIPSSSSRGGPFDRRKKTVAIVVSSEAANFDAVDPSFEHPVCALSYVRDPWVLG